MEVRNGDDFSFPALFRLQAGILFRPLCERVRKHVKVVATVASEEDAKRHDVKARLAVAQLAHVARRDALGRVNLNLVQASLDALIRKGDSTVVLVAHRLSTVMNADKIAVISEGGVKEEGSHDELCAKGGVYAGLVRKQLTKAAAVLDQGKEDAAEAQAANDTIDKLLG